MENNNSTSNTTPPLGGTRGANKLVIEIDGVRHRLVKNEDLSIEDSCKRCSLFGLKCSLLCEEFLDNSESDFYFTKENQNYEKE